MLGDMELLAILLDPFLLTAEAVHLVAGDWEPECQPFVTSPE